ncbi:MAG: hypothetical protein Tsb0014_28370 [Pleurocapsa sp.]
MALYNSIGRGYNCTHRPDLRIVEILVQLLDLPLGAKIADIGAGTGNYSRELASLGYQVIAIEPSEMMQTQAVQHPNVSWLLASAEQIPLGNNSVDGAIVMLALHHFQDIDLGLREIQRIVDRGKIVIFAFEQDKIPDFWLTDYFPYFIQDTKTTFPSTKVIADKMKQITQKRVEIMTFPLPKDLTDLFAAAGWCRPEIYLDAKVRNGISSFAKMTTQEVESGLEKLAQELKNGIWEEKYGELRRLESYDAGYRIIVAY